VEENPYGHVASHVVEEVAKRRQDIAHQPSGGANPIWDQLRPQDQQALLDEAQEWLRAAFEVGEIQLAEQPATRRGVPRSDHSRQRQPFTPPAHYLDSNGVECCVHTIPVGPDSCRACRELEE